MRTLEEITAEQEKILESFNKPIELTNEEKVVFEPIVGNAIKDLRILSSRTQTDFRSVLMRFTGHFLGSTQVYFKGHTETGERKTAKKAA